MDKIKINMVSVAIDDDTLSRIKNELKVQQEVRKHGEKKVSKSDIIRRALEFYFQYHSNGNGIK